MNPVTPSNQPPSSTTLCAIAYRVLGPLALCALAACGGASNPQGSVAAPAHVTQAQRAPEHLSVSTTEPPALTVDGSAADWAGVSALASANSQKVTTLKASVQGGNLYVLVQGQNLDNHYDLFLNTDNNPNTGYRAYAFRGSGADYRFSDGVLYKSRARRWSWATLATADVSVAGNATVLEVRIALADLGIDAAQFDSLKNIGIGFQLLTTNKEPDSQLPLAGAAFAAQPLPASSTPLPGSNTVTYSLDSSTIFPNPERGFYAGSGDCRYDLSTLQAYRNSQNISLVLCEMSLAPYVNSSLSAQALSDFNNAMSLVRQAGLKAVVRFGYSFDLSTRPQDTTKAQMLSHIAQLKPLLKSNADVIATMQAGFIGVWGEWFYTDYFGNNGVVSAQQLQDRKQVLEALLDALPTTRAVALRTPAFKQAFYGASPLGAGEAFANTAKARVGHHNDCFLASSDDFGTYNNVSADKAYLAQDALYTPQGGETCGESAFSGWANANLDMRTLHYSYLNSEYQAQVLASWGSNIDIAKRNLGYRLSLTQGSYSTQAVPGGSINVSFTVNNDGYAAPFNPRKLELVLRSNSDAKLYRFALNADPRLWASGTTSTVSQTLALTGVPAGSYALLLNLPDPEPTLYGRPEYAIRLANTGLWEASTGFNALNHTLLVSGSVTATPAKVFIIGDSTVAKYEAAYYPLTGWGDRMANYYGSNITFDDEAVGGTSAKSFYNEGLFAPIAAQLKRGDYLFIQFGHNDCCTTNPVVKTAAQLDYKQFLTTYIDAARQKGAIPVLVTPMNTRNVENGVFVYNEDLAPYAAAMRELAVANHVPLIDLAQKSLAYLNSIGYPASSNVFVVLAPGTYPNYPLSRTDDVHFQDFGATQMARLVTEGVRENKLEPLASSIK